jgi:hypothetical protein
LNDTLPVYLSFDVKKSISKNADKDTLLIFLSDDCGDTWNKIATLNLNSILVKDSLKWNNVEIEEINKNYLKQFTLIKFAYKGFNELNFDNLSITNNKQVKNTASVTDILENKFTIYPNPTDQHLNVTWNTDFKVSYIMLTDVLGKKVKDIQVNTQVNSIDLDLSSLAKGTYYVNLINPDFIQVSKPIMVR